MNASARNKVIAGIAMPAALAIIVALVLNQETQVEPPAIIQQEAYIVPPPMAKAAAPVAFTDVTAATGIEYRHYNGSFTTEEGMHSRYMPETMGSGAVLFDYDNDNDLDIFLANSSPFEADSADKPTAHLYRNEGNFRFTDVTAQAGLAFTRYGMGAVAADYDGDRYQDLLVTTWGGPLLLRNRGNGSFADASHLLQSADREKAGYLRTSYGEQQGRESVDWSTGAVFFDADGDLDLDLFIINYVRWSPDNDLYSTMDGKRKSYNTPHFYQGSSARFYIQEAGNFVDNTRPAGLFNTEAKALGVSLWDFNDDGLLDIAVANDTQPNFLYYNRGDGKFEEVGLSAGIAYDENGRTRAGMGIDIADYANDGRAAIAIGNFSREPVSVFKQQGEAFFREFSQRTGVAAPTYLALTFGLVFADMDLDGWQDLLLANGHTEPYIQDVEAEIRYRQPLMLLGNTRDSRFADWSGSAGAPFNTPMVGRGLAVGDLDGDGDLDIVATENNGPLHIIRNDADLSARHYLRVALRGRAPNTDAIGAKIELESGGMVQRRIVRNGSSYLSQSELTQTFGLGGNTTIDRLTVIWPNGKRVDFNAPEIDRTLVIDENELKGHQ